jgi:hypothetical protein
MLAARFVTSVGLLYPILENIPNAVYEIFATEI